MTLCPILISQELRDQNDEYVARLEQKPSETGSENSSYLSEYFKSDLHDLQDSYDNQSNDSGKMIPMITKAMIQVKWFLW